ncbi:hypothetical protein E1B28_005921 [Marasmius oreades]|uniref:Sm domain-containing protein n=1 Tax=Marasmius oreades TaxID=181124 RepID=A0A9P7S4T5_9AGAR|nr:uncharacterized protein E1B28_005921 [Marasmius oreades]KAG7095140.1 hypothetical protein E1B28_005921 [Marasmius oreades]
MSTHPLDAVNSLRSLLNNVLRISVLDGRIFLGSFLGTDQALNLLIADTEEFRILNAHSKDPDISNWDGRIRDGMFLENPKGRYVGQVLIPWKQVVKVESHRHEDSRRLYL